MRQAKVPFGYHVEDAEFKDVREVPGGNSCGCICPSCELPLIARKGEKNIDHFAHLTRGEDKKVLEECEFSYWVAVAAMARQIFKEADQMDLDLPEYTLTKRPIYPSIKPERLFCSEAQKLTLTDIQINKSLFDSPVDVLAKVKGVPFAIRFIYPGLYSVPPVSDWNANEHRAAAVVIQLENVEILFEERKGHLKETLREFLKTDAGCKYWLYHPRMQHEIDKYDWKVKMALQERMSAERDRAARYGRSYRIGYIGGK